MNTMYIVYNHNSSVTKLPTIICEYLLRNSFDYLILILAAYTVLYN